MSKSKYGNVNKDYNLLTHLKYKYRVSTEELLLINDFYMDFTLLHKGHVNSVQQCDSLSLMNHINANYLRTDPLHRLSAKIVASNDPVLNIQGVPGL